MGLGLGLLTQLLSNQNLIHSRNLSRPSMALDSAVAANKFHVCAQNSHPGSKHFAIKYAKSRKSNYHNGLVLEPRDQ